MTKRILFILGLAAIGLMLAFTGCDSDGGDEIVIDLAPIHEVKVRFAESDPPQVLVVIKGGLADSCTTFDEIGAERSGTQILLVVTTQRPAEAACAQVYSFFTKNLNLGSDFVSGQSYTLNVNDYVTSFVMP